MTGINQYIFLFTKRAIQNNVEIQKNALISHASKILLRILQKRLETFITTKLPIEQAGFRRGIVTRDHIANLRWMMEKARDHK